MDTFERVPTPAWYRGLDLADRLRTLHATRSTVDPRSTESTSSIAVTGSAVASGAVDESLAERRLQRWKMQSPFESDLYLKQRLAQDRMTEEEWFQLLGEPAEAIRDRGSMPPSWLTTMERAYSRTSTERLFPIPTATEEQQVLGFLEAVRPLLDDGWERLMRRVRTLHSTSLSPPFDPDNVAQALAASLPWQVAQMLSRTMILELNVARLLGELSGDTSEARFDSFQQRLKQGDVVWSMFLEYPVLARQVVTAIDQWVEFSLEFLQHLCTDWTTLKTTFFSESDPGPIIAVKEAGDSHRGGRSVMIATFANGSQIVYKPKPLAVDSHFQGLLLWMNERGLEVPFRPLVILNRGEYGWVEFVEARECESESEVRRFYERQGGQLALLYALEATDLHSENLIAVGEHPVFVDLETLFHPHTPTSEPSPSLADTLLDRSVLRTGLLPERIWSGADSEGIDISGLGGELEQQTPFGVPRWEGTGTDQMRVVYKQVLIPGAANRPSLHGQSVEVSDYSDAVADGFMRIYRILMDHREALLADGGAVARFAEDDVRVILRPTTTYCVLMRESFHPDLLRDGLERDQLFDRLWVKVVELPCLARVIAAERDDLWRGDIPVFTTRPNSRELWTSSGACVAEFFDQSGMEIVRQRMEKLSDSDMDQQAWIIRASMATLAKPRGRSERPRANQNQREGCEHHADREQLLAAARAVGKRLETLALRDTTGTSWVGLTAIDERQCTLELLGTDLYDGLPGVALFLAYLGAATGEDRWTSLAQSALPTLLHQVRNEPSLMGSIGAFSGWGGVIYALTHLATLWSEPSLIAEAAAMSLRPQVEQDHHFDIVSGTAGLLASLVSLYRCAPTTSVLLAARACGDHLLAHAQPAGAGMAWPPTLPAQGPLTGFSHGTSGIGWSLAELAEITGDPQYAKVASAAVQYERGLFSPQMENWPDLRSADEPGETTPGFVTAWCHGAPGIGLARLNSLKRREDPLTRAEVEAAVRTTIAYGVGRNHSLCHGDLGNLELLLQATQILDLPMHRVQLDRLASRVLQDIRQHGWICGVPQGVESPGLMTGLAGIGYGLLRLADPMCVPSVLTLESPKEITHAG